LHFQPLLAEREMMPLFAKCKCGGSGQMTTYLNGNDDVTSAKIRCTNRKCRAETQARNEEEAVRRWNMKNA
jgi:hypothetical protein